MCIKREIFDATIVVVVLVVDREVYWSGRFSLKIARSFPSTRRERNNEAMVSLTKHPLKDV